MPKKLNADQLRAAQDERAKCIADAGKIVADCRADGDRAMSAEESQKFDALHDKAADLYADVQFTREQKERADKQTAAVASLAESRGRQVRPNDPGQPAGAVNEIRFNGRPMRLAPGSALARRADAGYVDAFTAYVGGDTTAGVQAALQTDSAADGGYLAPPQFVAELVQELNNTFWFRQIARVLPPTTAPKVTMPRRTSRMNSFVWGSELSVPTADNGLKFGTYNLTPHYITGEVEVSNDLIRAAVIDPDKIVRSEINFRGGELEEQAFLYGDGAGKPLGVFAPDPNGIGTDRDVTGDPALYDTWADAMYSLREPYLRSPNLRWLLHRNGFRLLSKIKTTTGEPIWLQNVRDGKPDTLLGKPMVMSEYSPAGTGASNTYASGNYVGLLGDFAYYDIQDGLDLTIVVMMDSYYARRNMVGYIVRRKVDGCPRIAEAFARVVKA